MRVITEDVCPCCGAQEPNLSMWRDEHVIEAFRLLSKRKYGGFMDGWEKTLSLEMAQCKSCGHIWHHTRPDQASLFRMYAHGKRLKGGIASTQPSERMLFIMRGLYRYSASGNRQPTLLDYGSGAGRWSSAARQVGFRVTAYEPAASRQRRVDGIEVVGSLQAISGECFDVINLEQVLEHIPNPADDLLTLKNYCSERTILRISVPDVARFGTMVWADFPFDGKTMHVLSPYEHLHGFRRKSLRALLHMVGLRECFDPRLAICFPSYVIKKMAIKVGSPLGRTTVLARFRKMALPRR